MSEFDEWLSEREAAAEIGKSTRTLRVWRRKRIGPPYTMFGRTVKYRKPALVEHFRKAEITPARARPRPGRPRKAPKSESPKAQEKATTPSST
jgi:transposase